MAHPHQGRRSRVAAVLLALAFSLTIPLQAAAAGSPIEAGRISQLVEQLSAADDPHAAFEKLTPRQQQAVLDYTEAVTVTNDFSIVPSGISPPDALVTAAAIRCWTWTWSRQGRNLFGVVVWQFSQQIDWCGDGARITNTPFRKVYASHLFLFWTYDGLVESVTQGGRGFSTYRSLVQGSFSYCPPPGVCWQNPLPWLDMTAHADGRGTGSGGG